MMSIEVLRRKELTWKKCYIGEQGEGPIVAEVGAVDAGPIALSFPIRTCEAVNEENNRGLAVDSRTRCRSAKWSFGTTCADHLSLGAG